MAIARTVAEQLKTIGQHLTFCRYSGDVLTRSPSSLSLSNPPRTSKYSPNRCITHSRTCHPSPSTSACSLSSASAFLNTARPSRPSPISLMNTRCNAQMAEWTTCGSLCLAIATSSSRGFGLKDSDFFVSCFSSSWIRATGSFAMMYDRYEVGDFRVQDSTSHVTTRNF
jgi:hypothetical protein